MSSEVASMRWKDYRQSWLPGDQWSKWEALGLQWLQDLVRIDTTNPPGNEELAADWIRSVMDQYGVNSEKIVSGPGRSNVVARLEAQGSRKGHDPLLLTAHMDVVAHDRKHWTQDPFAAEIVDGWMYGRGTIDMKYVLVEHLVTFLALRESGVELERDLIFLALADEEAGCEYGAKYMVEHHRSLIEARWGLNELGGFPIYLKGRWKVYLVQTAEKGLVWFKIKVPGTPGHGSIVQDDNPVSKAAAVVQALQKGVHPHSVTVPARDFIVGLSKTLGPAGIVLRQILRPALYSIVRPLVGDEEQQNVFRAILHNTANPTMMNAGLKVNVVPSEVEIGVDGRTLPGQTTESFLQPIRAILPEGCEIEVVAEGDPYVVPANGALYSTIQGVVEEADPGVPVIPYLMNGFSDSKWLGQLGAEIYGFAPVHFPRDVALTKLVHGHDERIPVDGFKWGMRVHAETVNRFCRRS